MVSLATFIRISSETALLGRRHPRHIDFFLRLIGFSYPQSDLLAIRIVYSETGLEGFVDLVVLHVSILVCKYIPKADRSNERVGCLFVDDVFTIKGSNRAFGCCSIKSELL